VFLASAGSTAASAWAISALSASMVLIAPVVLSVDE
jgi:hypothetical protein